MKKLLFVLLSLVLVPGFSEEAFRLADVVIAYEPGTALTPKGTNWLQSAVRDLQTAIEKTTGRRPAAYEEAKLPADVAGPVIYLGDTAAARAAGVADETLRRGDWRIRTEAGRAYLYARSGMGASYASSDFVERHCGLLYLTPEGDDPFVRDPSRTVSVADATVRPAFYSGIVYPRVTQGDYLRHRRFAMTDEIEGEYRVSRQVRRPDGTPSECHSSYCYLPPEKHFKDHPEWYSVVQGRRSAVPVGQICMSNPEARAKCLEALLGFIAADRREFSKDPPKIYDFGQQDNIAYMCECPACRAICAKYNREPGGWAEGGDAGLQLEFVNWIAERVAKVYPDVWIRVFAYWSTEVPPKPDTIRPAPNVMIWWCDLFGHSDHTRPITDADFNIRQANVIDEWCRIARRVQVWDYMLYGGKLVEDFPEWSPDAIFADAKFFRSRGLDFIFMETEACELFPQPFHGLNNYLLSTAYRDPDANLATCVKNYCRVYGKGLVPMARALASLRNDMAAGPCRKVSDWPHRNLPWRSRATMERFRDLVKVAYDAETAGTSARTRVARVLASVSRELFAIYRREGAAEERTAAAKAYAAYAREYAKGAPLPEGDRQKLVKKLEDAIAVLDLRFRNLPDELKDVPADELRCADYHFCGNYLEARIRPDDESETGFGFVWKRGKPSAEHPKPPIPCGVYDNVFKSAQNFQITAEMAGTSEKYHWIRLGRCYVGPNGLFWMPGDWTLGFRLGDFYRNPEGLAVNPNWYDLYISLKVTGPAYVPGSTKENGLWVDRIVLRNIRTEDRK